MIIMLKNTGGLYRPLDLFEDFKITYNHQYEDYKTVGGKLMPYTNKFKIPTTTNNRDLCGLPFDLAYPTRTSVEGQCLYSDGTLAFEFIADIEGQVVNVLQPFISITIIDKISKAISDLSKWKMSDLMSGNTFNFLTDTWVFGDQSDLTDAEKYFLFVYHNYNNKNALFSHDPMRGLSQLHPTFILNRLVDKMFNYVGLTVESDFLNIDNQLASGINANQLALTIPASLKTLSNYQIVTDHSFGSLLNNSPSFGTTERVVGIASQMPTTNRLTVDKFLPLTHEPLKMNYDLYADDLWEGSAALGADPYKAKFCSMVDGRLKVQIEGYDNAIKPVANFGALYGTDPGLNNRSFVTSVDTVSPPDLDIKIVNADTMNREGSSAYWTFSYWEQAESYDIKNGYVVGKAVFIGVDPTSGTLQYELRIDALAQAEFDVKANDSINLCYVLVPPNGDTEYSIDYHMTDTYEGGDYTMRMIIKEGYLQYQMLVNNGTRTDSYYETQSVWFSRPDGVNEKVAKLTFSYDGYTDLPCGYVTFNGAIKFPVPNVEVDMGESIKSINDYSLLEVLQMIMERFNLQMYTTSDGLIHVDTEDNRKSGIILNIDHLIDEGMDANFSINENGVLSIKDSNASFYDSDFNRLDKYSVSDDKREEVSISFKTGIVNPKMFEDVYDKSSYDVLRYGYDSNYWGTSDRTQLDAKSFKPTFCILEANETPVYIPTSKIQYSVIAPCITDENDPNYDADCIDFFTQGFYNIFKHDAETGNTKTKLKASNVSVNGFKLISFEDDDFIAGEDNLFKKTWYQNIMSRMRDDSVAVEFQMYASEDTFKILKDFATIRYRGQDWDLKGVNDFPLSDQNGGITKISIIKSVVWS